MRGCGLEASDWSGSGCGSSGALGGEAGGDTRGLGLRRGEREGLRLRSFLGGERLLGDGERDFLLWRESGEQTVLVKEDFSKSCFPSKY